MFVYGLFRVGLVFIEAWFRDVKVYLGLGLCLFTVGLGCF